MTTSIRPSLLVIGLIFALALEPTTAAQAQLTLDVSKLTCGQFLSYKIATADKIAAWLSGFHSGKRDNTSLDTHALIGNAKKLRNYCVRNSETLLMNAVETVLGAAR